VSDIDEVRQELRKLDAALVDLVAQRIALARRAGELKLATGQPIRNYAVEAEVIRLARERAAAEQVPEDLAEELMKMLIRESLRAQETDRLRHPAARELHKGRRALVVGGAGNMGRWFAEFLETKGFGVSVADPRASAAAAAAGSGRPVVADVAAEAGAFDLVLVATPPSAVGPVLRSLTGRTDGLVFEIGSLKSPFLRDLKALAASGANVTSVHPMWGPSAQLLASKNVVVCDCGNADANRAARALFEDTAARIVEVPVDEHDAYMARTLGLPHALNLVFGHALFAQGVPLERLDLLGGPTFRKQVAVSEEVAHENKDLYFEIQKHNPHTPGTLRLLRESLEAFEAAVATREAFLDYMAEAESYFGGEKPA
jgi:chorismate mutase/prephenate dehydrogenase